MEFLRKAYDSLGSEISKTFDSTKEQPDPDVSLKSAVTSDWADTPNKSKKADDEESWGDWDDASRKPQAVTEGKGRGRTPPARGDPSTDGSDAGERGGGSTKAHVPWPPEATTVPAPSPQDATGGNAGGSSQQQLPIGGGGQETTSNAAPLATSTPTKAAGKSQLETLTKEELVKYVKKQAQLLQKTKSRCDELTKECEQLKASSPSQSSSLEGNEVLLGELHVLKAERDAAVAEVKGLRQTTTGLEGEKKHISSQLSAIREEYDLLRQSFRQLQEDTASREEDLRCQAEASHTRLSAITEQARDKEKDLQGEIGILKERVDYLGASNRELEAKLCAIGDGRRGEEGTDSAEGKGSQDLKDVTSELAITKEELTLLKARCNQLMASEGKLSQEKVFLGEELMLLRKQLDTLAEDARRRLAEVEEERDKGSVEVECLRQEAKTLHDQLLLSKESSEQRLAAVTREKGEVEADLGGRIAAAMAMVAKEQEARELLARELSDARLEVERLQKSCSDGDERLRASCVEKESFQRSVEDLRLELTALRQGAQRREEEALEAGNARETALQEKQRLLEALQEEVRSAGVQSERMRSEVESLGLRLKAAVQEKEAAVGEADVARRDRGTLETRTLELEGALQRRGDELHLAREATERAVSELEARLKVQELAFETLKAERDSLQTSKDAVESDVGSRHQEEVKGYLVKLKQLERENKLLKDAKVQLSSELEQLTSGGLEKEKRMVAVEKSNEELQLELQKMREQYAKSAEGLKTLEEQDALQKEEHKKLKMFVVKLKKELSEAKSKEASLKQQLEAVEGSPGLQGEVKALQTQLAEEQERVAGARLQMDALKREMVEERSKVDQERHRITEECQAQTKIADSLVKELEAAKSELTSLHAKETEIHSTIAQLTAENGNLTATLRQLTESRDLLQSETNALKSDLSTAVSEKVTHKLATEAVQKELASLRDELAKERVGHVETKEKLMTVEKEAKANSVMDLELADYRRSVEQLRSQLSDRDSKIEAAKREKEDSLKTLEQLKKELETLKQKNTKQEENLKKISSIVKTRNKELEDTRKQEGELQTTIGQIQAELEAQRQLAEGAKVEVADLTARLLSTQQQSQVSVDTLQKMVSGSEAKMASLQGELKATQASLQTTQQEYESYKVRVHSVLKQKSSGPNEIEASRELKQKYESECMELRAEMKGVKGRLSSVLADHQELTAEHERLVERHDQLMKDSKDTQERLTKKLHEDETRHLAYSQEQADLVVQLRQEMHSMATSFRDQLHTLKDSGQRSAEGLREELRIAHAEISRLQRKADVQVLTRAAASGPDGVRTSLRLQEGMEQQSEIESVSSFPATPVSLSREDSQLSLEHLLSSAPDSSTADVTSTEKQLSAGEAKLRQQLKVATKKMDHLTELLHESEAASFRFGEQTKLLKEEIRRLERNQQREESVSNMEYLKNVVLKFLQGKSEERTNLIPVITRLLQLSPQEVAYVEQTLKGNAAEIPTAASDLTSHNSAARKGWASYMQRWTGY